MKRWRSFQTATAPAASAVVRLPASSQKILRLPLQRAHPPKRDENKIEPKTRKKTHVIREVAAGELWQRLDDHLGANRARILTRYYRSGMTLPEIAEAEGVALHVAEKRLRDAKKKIRTSKLFCRFFHEICH